MTDLRRNHEVRVSNQWPGASSSEYASVALNHLGLPRLQGHTHRRRTSCPEVLPPARCRIAQLDCRECFAPQLCSRMREPEIARRSSMGAESATAASTASSASGLGRPPVCHHTPGMSRSSALSSGSGTRVKNCQDAACFEGVRCATTCASPPPFPLLTLEWAGKDTECMWTSNPSLEVLCSEPAFCPEHV